jgi:hypothetical protein
MLAELFAVPSRIVELDDAQALEWARVFFVFMRPGSLFICKRRARPRIGVPGLGASPGRVNLPQTPFFTNWLPISSWDRRSGRGKPRL